MESGVKRPEITEVLSEIASALVGHFEMSRLLDQVVNTSMRTLHAQVCSIFLEDREKEPGILTMMAGSGFAQPLVGKARYAFGEGFTGFIAKHSKGLNVRTRGELESLEFEGRKVWQGKYDHVQWSSKQSEFRNCIALPLRIKDRSLGVIKVENKLEQFGPQFTEEDVRHFETIANVVALAIENARLHQQIERQLKTIAAKAAHRINNQASNYDGIDLDLADECEAAVPDKQKLREIHGRIRETTTSLKRMIEEFKNYGKPLQLVRRFASINQVIKDEVWYAKPPPNIDIQTRLDKSLPDLFIDAARFAEAFKEILRNSIKAISKNAARSKGHICISTGLSRRNDPDVVEEGRGERTAVLIRVEDDGPGFPPGFPVFEPFHSTDPSSIGMGLATVKELVEAHDGQILAVPERSVGACLEIRIPTAGNQGS